MYKLEFTKSFFKDFRKLSKEVQREIVEKWFPRIQEKPDIGERFVGHGLKSYLKIRVRFKKNDYRIVYQLYRKQLIILMIAVGTRENFYKRLERRL